jgi:hypothetical protein
MMRSSNGRHVSNALADDPLFIDIDTSGAATLSIMLGDVFELTWKWHTRAYPFFTAGQTQFPCKECESRGRGTGFRRWMHKEVNAHTVKCRGGCDGTMKVAVLVCMRSMSISAQFFGAFTVADGIEQKSARVGRSHPSVHFEVARAARADFKENWHKPESAYAVFVFESIEQFVRDAGARVIQRCWRAKSNDPNTQIGRRCAMARYNDLVGFHCNQVSGEIL